MNNITCQFSAVHAVFGSLYSGNVILTPDNVISILGTAALFQMQELIDQCNEAMLQTIEQNTVIPYYNASETYGLLNLKKNALQWLELNLILSSAKEDYTFLRNISPELMRDLVSSPNLVIYGTDTFTYIMLRRWYCTKNVSL